MRRLFAVLTVLCLSALGCAASAAADTVSPRPDAVTVTLYNDTGWGLAMITETRTVDLPAGSGRLVFQGVADGIMPQTVKVEGLPAKAVEQNFDYDLLGPGALLDRAVGQTVGVVRTNRKTGRETRESAVLRSGPAGVVLDFGGGRIEALKCSGGAERLVFDTAPPGLTPTPTLSLIARTERPGRYTVKLSYLTRRLKWAADYIARLSPDGETLRLSGWITLENQGDVSFVQAPASVVAGDLARVWTPNPGVRRIARSPGCWPMGNSHNPHGVDLPEPYEDEDKYAGAEDGMMAMRAAPMMAPPPPPPPPPPPMAEQQDLGDYKLYVLPFPTTVAAHQTKQVAFLDLPAVKLSSYYVLRLGRYDNGDLQGLSRAAVRTFRFENKAAEGLGKPLPAGDVAVRWAGPTGREYLIGQDAIRNIPVGQPFELAMGAAADVRVSQVRGPETWTDAKRRQMRRDFHLTASNTLSTPVEVQIRLDGSFAGPKILTESQGHEMVLGQTTWRLKLGPGESATLAYSLQYVR